MPKDILFFVTWKTRGAIPVIDESTADELVRLLPELAQTERARILELAVVATHVHAVMRTSVRPDIPRLMQRLKGASARLLNRVLEKEPPLHWDPGYDVRTVGRRSLPAVRRYFDRQDTKHRLRWVRRYSGSADSDALDASEALSAPG